MTMGLGRRARRGAWASRSRRLRFAFVGTAVAVIGLLAAGFGAGTRTASGGEPIRLVLSSLASAAPAKHLSTATLYATNDPWRRYLANEQVCPGAERTDLPLARQAKSVACLVNFARKRRGVRQLLVTPILNGASAKKAKAILRCQDFAHDPCGGDWTASVRSTGYVGGFGENLYLGSGPFGAPRLTVDAWLNSPPHRENLFRAGWREQGVAVVVLDDFDDHRDVAVWVSVLGDDEPS
jgi:uncharacterized protein YkwD